MSEIDQMRYELNKKIGMALRRERESKALKRRMVVNKLPWLTGAALRKYERGTRAIPGRLMIEILNACGGDWMNVEFEIAKAATVYRSFLSKGFEPKKPE